MNLRIGAFALVIEWLPRCYGWEWSVNKWRYFRRESWKHGTARLGRIKIMW